MKRIAYAVVHSDPHEIFFAKDENLLAKILILQLVLKPTFDQSRISEYRKRISSMLKKEDWSSAVATWIEYSGFGIDVFSDEEVPNDALAISEELDLAIKKFLSTTI